MGMKAQGTPPTTHAGTHFAIQSMQFNQASPWAADPVKRGFLVSVGCTLVLWEQIWSCYFSCSCIANFFYVETVFQNLWELCVSGGVCPLSNLAETGKQVVKLLGSHRYPCLKHSLCTWFIHLIFTGGAERYHWDADPNCSQMLRWVQQDKWKMRNNMSL